MSQGWLIGVGIAVVGLIFLDLLLVELRRSVREGKRIARRLAGYGGLPIMNRLASLPSAVERVNGAFERIPPLAERATAALATIRERLPEGPPKG